MFSIKRTEYMKECKRCGKPIRSDFGDYCDECSSIVKSTSKLTIAENTVNILAYIMLVIGIIGSIILASTIVVDWKYGFNPTGFAITIGTLFFSILIWALLRLAIEVSINIRHIAGGKNG